jgi:hypothetical protein
MSDTEDPSRTGERFAALAAALGIAVPAALGAISHRPDAGIAAALGALIAGTRERTGVRHAGIEPSRASR